MNLKVVLFDLDGTLLPMDQDEFVKAYFGLLAKKLSPHGYDSEQLIAAIWAGTKEMIKNQSEYLNEKVFWDKFCEIFGEKVLSDKYLFDEYYENDFDKVQQVCGFNPDALKAVTEIKNKGLRVALATNPIFPAVATQKRIRWAGLTPEAFEFYTTYENSYRCKPNTEYYKDILHKLNVKPEECLMVGNDVSEDMIAKTLGLNVFLLSDCVINKENKDLSEYPQGDFSALLEFISNNI